MLLNSNTNVTQLQVSATLTVTRPAGRLSQVMLKGPAKLCTQSQKEFVLAVSASTGLGAQLAPSIWQVCGASGECVVYMYVCM
jgi:hypothetical protein